MTPYNILTGSNTVLRGVIAENYAQYVLSHRYPLLILRPTKLLRILEQNAIQGRKTTFLEKYQQTMDYFGIGPIQPMEHLGTDEILTRFFDEGLSPHLNPNPYIESLQGFIIEIKSRTTMRELAPFQYSFSSNQQQMFQEYHTVGFKVILCGVTFGSNWDISVIFTNFQGKLISKVADFNAITRGEEN